MAWYLIYMVGQEHSALGSDYEFHRVVDKKQSMLLRT